LYWKAKNAHPGTVSSQKYKVATKLLKNALLRETIVEERQIIYSNSLGQFYKHINLRMNNKTEVAPLKHPSGLLT